MINNQYPRLEAIDSLSSLIFLECVPFISFPSPKAENESLTYVLRFPISDINSNYLINNSADIREEG